MDALGTGDSLARREDDLRERAAPLISIASNFTAEPLEDSLQFWLTQLELTFQIEFAPFDQVFQQLLSPDSLLSRNEAGLNVVLLRLDPWLDLQSTNGEHPRDANLATLISALVNC